MNLSGLNGSSGFEKLFGGGGIQMPISSSSSDAGRWDLIVHSFNMWLDYPFFGAGLGAFYNNSFELTGLNVVIHNTALWILAEFGFLGMIFFLLPFLYILKYAIFDCEHKVFSNAIILLLLAFSAMSLFHEVFYQRTFWFVLGGLIALPKSKIIFARLNDVK